MDKHIEYYKGEGCGFPSSLGRGESCESIFAHGSSMHQKCSNYKLTNLLFGLCRSMWIIGLLAIHFSSHPKVPACPSTPEVIWIKKHTPAPYPFVVFTFGLAIKSMEVFKVRHKPKLGIFFPFYFLNSLSNHLKIKSSLVMVIGTWAQVQKISLFLFQWWL